ncbi:LysR family transcriptional regulator, partial [Klebsiella pneumoniae]|nr:LysR family transcriptional regulator [Klebsiella pneumoniae]
AQGPLFRGLQRGNPRLEASFRYCPAHYVSPAPRAVIHTLRM